MGSNLKSDIKNTHNWQWTTLGDVAEFINGDRGKNYPSSLDRVEKGIPFINTGHIEPTGRLSDIRMEYITREKYDKLGSGKVQPGDIVYCLRGSTIGKTAINSYSEGAIASSLIIIRAKDNICQGYLYYFLTSPVGQGLATINDNGSAQPNLSGRVLASYPLQIPNYQTQVSITKLLSGLDKKIHLNNETNETLEQMAQALFKSWFVDFDPVFDNLLASVDFNLDNLETSLPDELKQKAQRRLAALDSLENAAECKASLIALAHELQAQTQAAEQVSEKAAETPVKPDFNANPNILAQHANTHAHFPCEFEHNEQLGWIPKCWEKGTFKDIADGLSGYAFKGKDFSETGFAVLKIKNITTDRSVVINDVNRVSPEVIDKLQRFLLNDGDIIMAMTGATVGKFGVLVSEDNEAYYLNQRVCKLTPKMEKGNPFLFSALNQPGVEEGILSAAQGSAQPNISANGILATKLLVPSKKTIEIFNRLLEDIYERKITLRKECYKLTKLRDTLLPKLISGELQIPDVAIDEEVVD
jgi:type I restriction enzyme S subunit